MDGEEALERNVVFHIDELHRWRTLLSNVRNLVESAGVGNIKVLANGEAVSGLCLGADTHEMVEQLLRHGVRFLACRNSLLAQRRTSDDLLDGVSVVPVGVLHLAERQWDRWAYVRP